MCDELGVFEEFEDECIDVFRTDDELREEAALDDYLSRIGAA